MSFFGFDASLPGNQGQNRHIQQRNGSNRNDTNETLDFDDTYKGFGEYDQEEGDYLNDETFGANVELGNDFDFGHSAQSSNNNSNPHFNNADVHPHHRSYVQAATSGVQPNLDTSVDLKPMESLWSGNTSAANTPQNNHSTMIQNGEQKQVLSMEEIERQQRQMQMNNSMNPNPAFIQQHPHPPPQQQQQQYGNQMALPPQPYPMQDYNMPPPQGFMQPNANMNGQYQFMPEQQQQQFPPNMYHQGPPHQQQNQQFQGMYQQGQPNSNQGTPTNQQLPNGSMQPPMQPQPQGPVPVSIPVPVQEQKEQGVSAQPQHIPSPMTEQVPIQSIQKTAHAQIPIQNQGHVQQQVQQQMPPQTQQQSQQQQQQRLRQQQQRREPLSPEEQQRLQIRHAKVEKILKHAGLMTPRDKDFITRYQLSQIVTEDPYNEDFYFQVYKIIQRGGIVGESNKGLIARAYLEHSGHRLGGRYKRADIALQRMQSQVEKAVTVAKERPQKKNDDNASGSNTGREGVLGKVSTSMNSKAPRRQLQIPSSKTRSGSISIDDSEVESVSRGTTPGALQEVTESLDNVEISTKARVRRRSSYAFSSIDQNSVLSRSGGRKFVLFLIETVYEEVLELEANLRSGKDINNKNLWDALHIDDEAYEVSPFISMLSFDKGVKIMPRIFNFLDKQQKLKLLQTFFSELSHLNIIIISSYKTNPDPSDSQLKKIDLFQTVFLKIIVSFLSSSSNFIEIMGLLLHLIKNNNVSFISTSKIGLNLITVLISRAALIRQDINRTNVLSSPEISTWNEIYDKLFTALESKISAVFPPKEYVDKVVEVSIKANGNNNNSNFYDQAYIWQFLASLALSGKLNHQRIIIDEVREQIFGTITQAEEIKDNLQNNTSTVSGSNTEDLMYRREKLYQDLNLFLNVMGLVSRDGEISELK